ncbi:hypothetical protein Kfla_4967 [Kribbella flavida DSM 17836]|uniref:Alanine-rich protein n=1 Tax=Kribbella flavida (strain DSM 17836 / JCM 10339 / NBRC 14399) TaxID=479435 RepID=D2Q237_KRIFD|nr:hypothetical protein [Kribbella flavida]ADB33983.1 hypothetical protein Kfla_4967 [Kribbella flavida DSM 17836]
MTAVYLYPWDLDGDPAAPELIESLGASSVVLAAAYHSVRAATPRHPRHRIVEAPSGLYVPVRPEAWGSLRPPSASGWAGEDAFNRAAAQVSLPVQAWVVLTHSSAVGRLDPSVCVRSAFGDVYDYALCPSSEQVRAYAQVLVGEVARQTGVSAMVLEACGPMGAGHQSAHEKTAGADWSPVDQALLSICFCRACTAAYAAAGLDVPAVAGAIRAGLGASSVEHALGASASVVLEVRRQAIVELRTAVVAEARAAGVREVSLHASTDPWATGPAAFLDSVAGGIDCPIAPAWELTTAGARRVLDLHRLGATRIGAYVTALPPVPAHAETLATHWQSLLSAGATDLHIYHAGLASTSRLTAIREAIEAVTA